MWSSIVTAIGSALKIMADYVFPWWKKKSNESELKKIEDKIDKAENAVGTKNGWNFMDILKK